MKIKAALIHHIKKMAELSPKDFEGINIECVKFYMDVSNYREIVPVIAKGNKSNRNRFKLIIREVLMGRYNDSLYRIEDGVVTAMKFTDAINSRIYCKEEKGIDYEPKKVVMARGVSKKPNKNDKAIKSIIDAIKKYNYEYYE